MIAKTITTKIISLALTGFAACAIALAGIVAAPVSIARAEETTSPQGVSNARLEYRLKQMKLQLQGQQNRIDLARLAAEEAQDRIESLKAEGKDTASLESALAIFNDQIDEAQAKHDEAQDIIDAHAGFDANGKVTDAEQAKATLQGARGAMREAQEILHNAGRDFRQAVRDFRQNNKPNKPNQQQP